MYRAPADGPYDDYVSYIRDLPLIPHPEVFGLHENADITKEQKETHMVSGVLLLHFIELHPPLIECTYPLIQLNLNSVK